VTYPQQYAQPQMPGFPQSPEQQNPYGQQPYAAPPQQYGPPQGYPAAPQQYGPPQGYPQSYAPPAQPAPPLAAGSLDAFYQQPSSGGGAALKFEPGTRHVGVVSRPITNADIQQQTNPGNGQPAFFRDGRPKFVMKVPLQLQPTPDRPDGLGQWFVAGAARDELVRAMAEAGAPDGPPEAGAVIDITCTGTRPAGPGMNPAKIYQVRYRRPNAPQQPALQPAPASVQQIPAPPQQVPAQAPQTPVTPPAPPAPAATAELTAAQKALLAQLTGQTAA
jgi:hypothetical protein